MTEKIKHYLRGMASVFPISPAPKLEFSKGRRKAYLRTSAFQIYPAPKRFTEKNLPSFHDDAKALAGDWQRVGGYIRRAMEQQNVQEKDIQAQATDIK